MIDRLLLHRGVMEVLALGISGVAAIAAVLSWLASARSARAAELSAKEAAEVAAIEKERRHEERSPDCHVVGEEMSHDDDLISFDLTVRGPERRYRVTVEAMEGSLVPAIRLQPDEAVSRPLLDLGEVAIGAKHSFVGNTAHGVERLQRFLVTCGSNGETWTLYRDCGITWLPRVY